MRVLVVEDEKHIAKYLAKSLEAEGFAVDCAYDGPTGLEKALTASYDAITLDIMLPGMNGYAVCRELRASSVNTPVQEMLPFWALTAYNGSKGKTD